MVTDAWARSTAPMVTMGAAYFVARSASDDDIVSVSVPRSVATGASLYRTETDGAMASMVPMETVPLRAGASVRFEPGGLHVMLDGLARPLVAGQRFALTLRFRHASSVVTTVTVRD